MPSQHRLTANNITLLLQHYSVHNCHNEHVVQVIRSHVKHNVDSFSLIRLCVYVNYFINLKVKGEDKSFNYVITNSIIKKIKNDEFVDPYGLCLIAKFVLRERIKNGDLLSLLVSLVRSKLDATSSPFDVYNLVISLLTIQSEGLLRGGGGDVTTQGNTQDATHKVAYPPDGVTQLNEQNVHTLLHLYLKAEKVKNEELILIINTLSSMDRTAFFYHMNLTHDQRVQLYEALLRRVNFEERFNGKVLALCLFNLQRMIKLGEISQAFFSFTVMNLGAAFREATTATKLHARKNMQLVPNGVEAPTGGASYATGAAKAADATSGVPRFRTHFNLQEIGMVLQFYDALVGVSQGKRGNTGKLYEPSVHLLKESLLFYAQASYEKKVKMNTLDFCTLLKGFSTVFKNTFLDRNILPLFQNFLKFNEKRIKINELQIIIKYILEKKKKLDFFLVLCGSRKCSIFDHLQSVLLRSVLSESPKWWNKERVEACIMCFYYMSFLNFNPNTYLVVNQFVMDLVTSSSAVAFVPYVLMSKFNYHALEVRGGEAATAAQPVSAAAAVTTSTGDDQLGQKKQVTNDLDKMDKLYQLINIHFEKYKTFFVLNCIYALTKFLKDNRRTSGFPPFSNFLLPELFNKLSDRLFMHNGLGQQTEGNHIPTHYDYFINYVKYNYCLLFLCHYIDLSIFLQRVPLGVEFPFAFYTPFNAYLTAEFLSDYERFVRRGHFAIPRGSSEEKNEGTGPVASNTSPALTREVMKSRWTKIHMEKKKMLKNVTKYANAYCNVMSVHDLIHLIKTFKVVASLISSGDLSTLHTCISKFILNRNVKTSTSFELLTELIKFMYHFELQNGEVFVECHDTIVDILICTFRIVFKNLPDRADNNYLGMLQFSLLYVSHFVRGANLIFNSLSLTDLKRADYLTSVSPMNLDKYPQSSCTFQLQILKVLKGVVKNERRLLNEYRVGDTPYTVDILIT
ncbi:hypothetical protein AK88_00049 [Plasmodium fragile]|uniref:Uncharacterized protein n=1 Tax=Plasmodium fragile TaxID=5857 RepID=A0A0D9QUD2_PLAFR|nr:uncharacterized protein AK88_00049 [Plasmodium fragile]KJP90201.1 hypothetical protein AK88_00049 [Plasmodium fragile]